VQQAKRIYRTERGLPDHDFVRKLIFRT